MLSAVVERLIKALRGVRPQTVRQFFALANQHIRWELNDLARRLDDRTRAEELRESAVWGPIPVSPNPSQGRPNTPPILAAIESLPGDEREKLSLGCAHGLTRYAQ